MPPTSYIYIYIYMLFFVLSHFCIVGAGIWNLGGESRDLEFKPVAGSREVARLMKNAEISNSKCFCMCGICFGFAGAEKRKAIERSSASSLASPWSRGL